MIKYYPFELHTHTVHSDGAMRPEELADKAKERGLSGFALTDHNTTSGIPATQARACENNLIVIKGEEWTTFDGHLTVLGGHSTVKWTDITLDNINQMIAKAREDGDIVNIAHPKRMGSPVCTGCYMEYKLDYRLITGYEVWSNDKPAFNSTNQKAYAEYRQLLDDGYKLSCLYGDDWHNPRDNAKLYATTRIGAEGVLTPESALSGIRHGRTYISTGILMDLALNGVSASYGLGDTVRVGDYTLNLSVKTEEEFCNRFGIAPESVRVRGNADDAWVELRDNKAELRLSLKTGYILIEVIGKALGREAELVISSPIYIEEA